jgi:dTDP-4-dehydrorhamnose reductase
MDACETARMETFQANTLLPQTISRVCLMTNTPLGHVSSGCIFSGAKVFENSEMRVERDLNTPRMRQLYEKHPEKFFGFTELDEPNFTFRHPPCNFLGGTKALAEEALRGGGAIYIWRPRLPFNEQDDTCNFLTKLQSYARVYDHITSLSHLDDFVRACLDLVELGAPFGTYNVTNPGAVTTRQVVEMIQRALKSDRRFAFWRGDEDFYEAGTRAPRSACILDVTKLLRTGVRMRPVQEALAESLEKWQPSATPERIFQRFQEPAPSTREPAVKES